MRVSFVRHPSFTMGYTSIHMYKAVGTASSFAVLAVFLLPTPAHALSIADVGSAARATLCAIRAVLAIPCTPDESTFFVRGQDASPHMFTSAAADPFLSEPVADTVSPAPETHEMVYLDPRYVQRTEFKDVTDGLRGDISRALARDAATIPTPAPPAAPQPAPSVVYVSSGGSSRDYSSDIQGLWDAISVMSEIDTLDGVTITDGTFSGSFDGTFTGSLLEGDISAASLALSGGFTGTTISGTSLSITGTSTAATTTSAILDTHGQVCNIQAYGAVGDNATDNYAAIMDAIHACPAGGIVFFPPGIYRISETIVLDKPVSIEGTYAPRWTYDAAPRTSIKPTPSFIGSAIIHVRDKTISGETDNNDGGRISNITIDGNSYGSGINGIYFEGLVRDWKLTNVDITQTSGDGFEAAQGAGSGNARGFTIEHLAIYSPASHGFRATALNDSYLEDVLVVGGAQRGFYLTSMGETKISNSRAVFNALEGLYIDGASTNGGLQVDNFSTDRNDRHGVRISATGTTTISFTNLLTRRDGPNVGVGGEAPYAGVAIMGSAGSLVAPVVIHGLAQITGKDDSGSGPSAPATGVRVQYASYAAIDGVLWGVSSPYTDGGNNSYFFIGEESLLKTGFSSVTTTIYNRKWMIATSTTGLVYTAGRIGIGTTSPSAQLHTTGTVRFENFGAGTLATDANGNLSVSSDERLKDVDGPYDIGLDAIIALHPIAYHWNEESGLDMATRYAGFSAQDVKASIPEAVGEDKRGYLTLSDRPILAAVVNAIKTIWETVTGNTKKIDELETRIRVLEDRAGIVQPPTTPVPITDDSTTSPEVSENTDSTESEAIPETSGVTIPEPEVQPAVDAMH